MLFNCRTVAIQHRSGCAFVAMSVPPLTPTGDPMSTAQHNPRPHNASSTVMLLPPLWFEVSNRRWAATHPQGCWASCGWPT